MVGPQETRHPKVTKRHPKISKRGEEKLVIGKLGNELTKSLSDNQEDPWSSEETLNRLSAIAVMRAMTLSSGKLSSGVATSEAESTLMKAAGLLRSEAAEEEETDRLLQQANTVLTGFDERMTEINRQLDRTLAKLGV